jgi:Flp pilus assembly pilin Flp
VDKSGLQERSLAHSQSGVALIEYALLASLIAIAIVAALTSTGNKVQQNWNNVDQAVGTGTQYQT